MKNMKIMAAVVIAIGLCSLSSASFAASTGTVQGYIKFYQNQGNYCPTSRTCTGAKYLESAYHTNQPIQDVKVFIQRWSDEKTIGQGTTDSNGYFNISWSDSAASGNVDAKIVWRGEHKDSRFRIATDSGGHWIWWSRLTLNRSTATNAGTRTWGGSASPHALSNLYDGAHRMWANSLGQSNRMKSYFTGVEIHAWDAANVCPTSCASGGKTIRIDSEGSAYRPQARVMHEMGHIASYVASRDQNRKSGNDYCYNETPGCGWNLNSEEYGAVVFEEAVATILGDIAIYSPSATQPHTCNSSSACTTNAFNIETSLGTSCAAGENRKPINAIRYLWDNYDSVNDYAGETLAMGMWHIVDTLHAFDNGTVNRDKNEPWNAALTRLDDRDGRCALDFKGNWKTWGTDSTTQLNHNCGSVGD